MQSAQAQTQPDIELSDEPVAIAALLSMARDLDQSSSSSSSDGEQVGNGEQVYNGEQVWGIEALSAKQKRALNPPPAVPCQDKHNAEMCEAAQSAFDDEFSNDDRKVIAIRA